MKKQLLSAVLLLSSAVLFTACQNSGSTAAGSAADTETAQIQEQTEPDSAASSAEEANPEDLSSQTEQEETASDDAAETAQFIVDITDNLIQEQNMVIGNTSAIENYSGIIEIYLDDALAAREDLDIQPGSTYVFTIQPMMTMSIPPHVIATDVTPAIDDDIARLEEIRRTVSNFRERMAAYETMEPEEIIQDANFNYALWTQEEISEYLAFLAKKGYPEASSVTSYVNLRENLHGSVAGVEE